MGPGELGAIPLLAGKNNPLIRVIRKIAAQARKAPADVVIAEGIRVLEEVTALGCPLEAALVSEAFGSREREAALLHAWLSRGVPVRRGAAPVLKSLSDVMSFQGALALVTVPGRTLASMETEPPGLITVFCGLQDPGNLGTLLRTARAAGASWAAATLETVSARNPKAIRASAGAFFSLPIVEGLRPEEILDHCRRHGIRMYRAAPSAAQTCWTADLLGPVALFLGNEARGLSDPPLGAIPAIGIPMAPGAESLNVAAAGAVLLFEAFRQRTAAAASRRTKHE